MLIVLGAARSPSNVFSEAVGSKYCCLQSGESLKKHKFFFKNPGRNSKSRSVATTIAAAIFTFSLLSILADARPAIEVLHDTARCVAAYEAAHKAAELTGNSSTVMRFASERKKWRALLEALAQLASNNRDLGVIQDIRDSIANVYKEQFDQVILSLAQNEAIILLQIHDQCKELKEEIRNAVNAPHD